MMRRITIPGILWVFPVFILAMGGCKLATNDNDSGSSNNNGSLGKDTKLELATQLKKVTGDTDITDATYDGEVTDETGLFTGNIIKGKLTGSITNAVDAEKCVPLNEDAANVLVNFSTGISDLKLEFFKDIKLSPETDVKYAELKLQVKRSSDTMKLGNEKATLVASIPTTYEMATWVYVSKNVTITGTKKDLPLGVATIKPSKDLELKLTEGWNCIYRELKTLGTSYSVSIKKYDHWYPADAGGGLL